MVNYYTNKKIVCLCFTSDEQINTHNKTWLSVHRGEFKNLLQLFCLSDLYLYLYEFQSRHPLRLLLLHVNYIKLKKQLIIGIGACTNTSINNYDVCKTERYWIRFPNIKIEKLNLFIWKLRVLFIRKPILTIMFKTIPVKYLTPMLLLQVLRFGRNSLIALYRSPSSNKNRHWCNEVIFWKNNEIIINNKNFGSKWSAIYFFKLQIMSQEYPAISQPNSLFTCTSKRLISNLSKWRQDTLQLFEPSADPEG